MPDLGDDRIGSLTIDDLRTFLSVVTSGGQHKAANALGVMQSTVSRRLDRIQDRYGVQLFEDGPFRSRELTDAGAQLFKRVQGAMALLAPLPSQAARSRPLCIAFSGSVRGILVEALNRTEPEVACCLRETTGDEFRRLFAMGEIDAALSFDLSTDRDEHSGVIQRYVGVRPLALVLPADRGPLQEQPYRERVSGLQRSYISRSLLPKYNEDIKKWLTKHGIADHESPQGEVRTASEMFAMIARKKSFGFLPMFCASFAGNEVVFQEAEGLEYRSRLHFYVHNGVQAELDPLFENLKQVCDFYKPG